MTSSNKSLSEIVSTVLSINKFKNKIKSGWESDKDKFVNGRYGYMRLEDEEEEDITKEKIAFENIRNENWTKDFVKEIPVCYDGGYFEFELGGFTIDKKTRSVDGASKKSTTRVKVVKWEDTAGPDIYSDRYFYKWTKVEDKNSDTTPAADKYSETYNLMSLRHSGKSKDSMDHHVFNTIMKHPDSVNLRRIPRMRESSN